MNRTPRNLLLRRLGWIALFAALCVLVPACFFTIHETEVGIVTRFGKPREALAEPGLHVKLP